MLIFDEVQTGFGRTGTCLHGRRTASSRTSCPAQRESQNGLPLSAVVGRAEIMDKWTAGAHGGTFGAKPGLLRSGARND